MADTIWVPDLEATPPDADSFQLLVCVQTDRRLYVLIDGPPPSLPPPAIGQAHHVQVHTDTDEPVQFISGGTAVDRHRTTITVWYSALANPPEHLDIQLDVASTTSMRVRAVRAPRRHHFGHTAIPDDPAP